MKHARIASLLLAITGCTVWLTAQQGAAPPNGAPPQQKQGGRGGRGRPGGRNWATNRACGIRTFARIPTSRPTTRS
jgi:hypothetical protein